MGALGPESRRAKQSHEEESEGRVTQLIRQVLEPLTPKVRTEESEDGREGKRKEQRSERERTNLESEKQREKNEKNSKTEKKNKTKKERENKQRPSQEIARASLRHVFWRKASYDLVPQMIKIQKLEPRLFLPISNVPGCTRCVSLKTSHQHLFPDRTPSRDTGT